MIDLTPNARASHWAAGYVGRAWSEEFNCWELVRDVQRTQFNQELPPLAVLSPGAHALLAAVDGWRRATDYQTGDVLTMIGPEGPHVGVIVDGQVLHNVGGVVDGKCTGSVRIDRIESLGLLGYGHLKVWRAK